MFLISSSNDDDRKQTHTHSAFVSKQFGTKRKKTSKKGKVRVKEENGESESDRRRKNEWAAELKRRKRLRECKELSSQYQILESQLKKLTQNRHRLVSLLQYVKNADEKSREETKEEDPFRESSESGQQSSQQQQPIPKRDWRDQSPRKDTPFPFKRSKSTGYRDEMSPRHYSPRDAYPPRDRDHQYNRRFHDDRTHNNRRDMDSPRRHSRSPPPIGRYNMDPPRRSAPPPHHHHPMEPPRRHNMDNRYFERSAWSSAAPPPPPRPMDRRYHSM